MVMLDSARRKLPIPALARWLLGLGIAATLAAKVAHGLGHGLIGAAVCAWPAVALVGSYELLMMIIRGAQASVTRSEQILRQWTIPCRKKPHGCSPMTSRVIASPRCVPYVPNSTWASRERNGYVPTWSPSPAARGFALSGGFSESVSQIAGARRLFPFGGLGESLGPLVNVHNPELRVSPR